jgi:hypothetical protein
MPKITQGARIQNRRSAISGEEATVPPNNDHTLGWAVTDIYEGELFINTVDNKVWVRTAVNPIQFAMLDNNNKLPASLLPSSIVGAVVYQGTWDASTGNPPSITPAKGEFWIVNATGNTNLDGITDWQLQDWAIYDGAVWGKVDNSEPPLVSDNISYYNIKYTSLTNVKLALDQALDNSLYNTTLAPSLATPNPVGGIPAGTTVAQISGKTFTKLFDDLLFPTIFPTFIAPSCSFSKTGNAYYEIGQIISLTFTNNYNAGQILINGVFQNYRAGIASIYHYTGYGLPSSFTSGAYTDSHIVSNYSTLQGIQSWSSSVDYTQGPQPYDNKGNIYSTPLGAGTVNSSTLNLEGVYPIFATTSSITSLDAQTLYSMISDNFIQLNLVSESGGNKQKFEIALTWLNARPLTNVQTYNSISGLFENTGLSQWTVTTGVSETIQGNSVTYTLYTYNGSDRGATNIKLVF